MYTFPNGPDLNQARRRASSTSPAIATRPPSWRAGPGSPPGSSAQATSPTTRASSPSSGAASGRWPNSTGKTIATQKGSYIHRYLLGAVADPGHQAQGHRARVRHGHRGGAGEQERRRGRGAHSNYALAFQSKGYPAAGAGLEGPARVPRHQRHRGDRDGQKRRNRVAIIKAWQAAQLEATRQAKAAWDDYLSHAFNVELGPFGH